MVINYYTTIFECDNNLPLTPTCRLISAMLYLYNMVFPYSSDGRPPGVLTKIAFGASKNFVCGCSESLLFLRMYNYSIINIYHTLPRFPRMNAIVSQYSTTMVMHLLGKVYS